MRYMVPDMDREVTVYRLFDAANTLLYVGQTSDFGGRLSAHRYILDGVSTDAWQRRIDHWSTAVYPNRQAAIVAERLAILTECPLHNIQVADPWKVKTPRRDGHPSEFCALLKVRIEAGELTIRDALFEARGAGIWPHKAAHWLGMHNSRTDPFKRVVGIDALLELNGIEQ